MDLQEKHIQNLKIVLNREKLLDLFPKNGIVAELGVDQGLFSEKILSIAKPKKFYLIDMWDSERYSEKKMNSVTVKFKREIESGNIIIKKGISYEELEKFSNSFFDWIYIDTTHSYETTSKELEISRLKIKDGGLIAGHDYTQGNVEKGLRYGVVQALHEFCIKYSWELIYLTNEFERHLSFAVRKGGWDV